MKNRNHLFKSVLFAGLILLVSGSFNEVLGSITGQPRSVEFCIGSKEDPDAAQFTVKSDYLLGAKYQWQYYKDKNWLNFTDLSGITGSTTSKLTIPRPKGGWTTSWALTIRARVTEGKIILYSKTVYLTPQSAPSFTTQPISQTKYIGENATFTGIASGVPAPKYQWSYYSILKWYSITGATGSSYITGSARTYRVNASNVCGNLDSKSATLTLVGITTHPKSVTVCKGHMDAISFAVKATGATGYQWQRWIVDFRIKGGGYYEDMAGETASAYTILVPKGGFTTASNGQFRCVVTFKIGTKSSNSAVLTVNNPPSITSHPSDLTKVVGESATFTVSATSTITKSYQWYKDDVSLAGETGSSYNVASVEASHAGTYKCEVSNSCGTVTSNGADLTVEITDWPDGWFAQAEGLTSKDFQDVHFASPTEGWVVAAWNDASIYHTIDGGDSWEAQALPGSKSLLSVYFTDSEHGWASGNNWLYYTVNGGTLWTELYLYSHLGNKSMSTYDIHFTSSIKGWMVGYAGMIVTTDDGGANWTIQNDGSLPLEERVTNANLNGVHFLDDNTGYVCGESGTILKTVNGGTLWEPQTTPNSKDLLDIFFIDADTGYAVGYYDAAVSRATILKTTNGGGTWEQQTPGPFVSSLLGVSFTDSRNGVTVGNSGAILRTSDGGATWYKQTSNTTETLNAVHFADAENGWAVGYASTVVRTATGGCLTPSVNLYEDKFLCANLDYQLVADSFPNNADASYLWSPGGETTGSLTVDATGTYSVDVTNICGVTRSDEILVTFYDLPVADAGDDVEVCFGDTVQLNASGGLTYSWVVGTGGGIIKPPIIIRPPKLPGLKSEEALAYISDPGISNPLVAGFVGTTTFTVTVTDINDCSSTDEVDLITYLVPTAEISAPEAFCRNAEVIISYSGNANDTASYYWDFDSGVATPVNESSRSVVWDTSGIQTITFSVNEAGCYSDTARFDVTVNPIPMAAFIMQEAICDSGFVDIYYDGAASQVANFEWDFDGGMVAAGDSAGPYQIYWTEGGTKKVSLSIDDKGCLSDTISNDIRVSYPFNEQVICLATVDIETGKNAIIWEKGDIPGVEFFNVYRESNFGGKYDLIATLPDDTLSYFVDEGSQPALKSHKYRIAVIDTCGNESDLSYYHKTMLLTTGLGTDRINVSWTEYEVQGAGFGFVSYIIYRGPAPDKLVPIDTIPADNTLYPDINPPAGDNYYQVAGVARDACSPSGNFKAGTGPYSHSLSNLDDNKLKEENTGIDAIAQRNALRVYPNPFREKTRVNYQLRDKADVQIEVYNLLGVRVLEVYSGEQLPGTYSYDIMANDLDASSLYYLKFSVNGMTAVKKLVPAK